VGVEPQEFLEQPLVVGVRLIVPTRPRMQLLVVRGDRFEQFELALPGENGVVPLNMAEDGRRNCSGRAQRQVWGAQAGLQGRYLL
jgi:hypothetical protein